MKPVVYLDTSAVVKRYVLESGSNVVSKVYNAVLNGEALLSFSIWNIGEVLGVLDKYYRRGWLTSKDYELARIQFIGETIRLLKLELLRIIPVKTRILVDSWRLIEKYHIYAADALQIVSTKYVGAEALYTADKTLYEAALEEGIKSILLQ